MHIKKIIIEGFKSYKKKMVLDSIHPNLNVIVGSNGAGKTNILYAIQFVLSDEFYPLQRDVRKSLLFSNSGPHILTASVEIVFDNTDGRFPIQTNEVSLSRSVGPTTDRYQINKQACTHKEMKNLLTAAGISSCNPYYIVKQGKVNELATATDSHRLNILLEIAAVHVSEEKMNLSKKILEGYIIKLSRARKLVDNLNKKLKDLELEKNNAETFNELNKRKSSLQFCLYKSELEKSNKELDEVEEIYTITTREQNEHKLIKQRFEKEVERAASLLEKNKKQVKESQDCFSKLSVEEQQLKTQIEEIKFKTKSLQDESTSNTQQTVNIQNKLSDLNKKMTENDEKLKQLKLQYDDIEEKERSSSNRLLEMKRRHEELLHKFGHGRQFASKEERDTWLHSELQSLQNLLSEMELKKDQIQAEMIKEIENVEKLQNDLEKLKHDLIQRQQEIDQLEKLSCRLLAQNTENQSQLRETMRKEAEIGRKCTSLMNDFVEAKYTLYSIANKNLIIGLDGMKNVLEILKDSGDEIVEGYHGMLIDVLEWTEQLNTVVEVIAGRRLFYHIVANEELSAKITKVFNENKYPGEINFFLLNQLRDKKYSDPNSRDALLVIRKLKFDMEYERAANLVFGRTLLCRNMDVALQFTDKHNMDCITLNGDQVLKSGLLSGGYRDKTKQMILKYRNFSRLQTELREAEDEADAVQEMLRELKDKITKNCNKESKIEKSIIYAKNEIEKLKSQRVLLSEKLSDSREVKRKKEKLLTDNQSHIDLLESRRVTLQHELHEEMADHLSVSEQRTLDQLNDHIRKLTEECENLSNEKLQLQYDKELTLKNIFNKEYQQLTEELEKLNGKSTSKMLETLSTTLELTEGELHTISEQLKDIETGMNRAIEQTEHLQEEYENRKTEEIKAKQNMETSRRELKLITSEKNTLLKSIEEHIQNIRNLGTLSDAVLHEYREMRTSQVLKELTELNTNLGMMHNINMQASLQYYELSAEKHKRQVFYDTIQNEYDAVLEMISHLEMKRNDLILFTFRQCSENFTKIFSKLVPEGHAELVMQDAEGQPLAAGTIVDIDIIKGVGVRVRFDDSSSVTRHFKEISGGQKSLVAITLILTLQACSQNPFFLFDEIDAMLDSNYRPKLAQLIGELSSKAQFIMTALSEEILHYGHQFYGVTCINKVSHVKTIPKQIALQIVTSASTQRD